ncbi:hypothetical protein [Anatilimnocola floriformis]|uniref:hypothetical protein n=1 Tax=Anatilimnocola floriformis TaxID=2948575 RepID=UPI0020C1CE0A|nr:hypothetical protein [Anatilimnocola floriformis]
MAASDIRAGRAFVELSVKNNLPAGMARALNGAKQQLQAFGAGMQVLGSSVARIGFSIAATFGLVASALAMPIKAAGDLMETVSKFEAVFADQAGATRKWSEEFAAAVGRSKSETLTSLSALQAFFRGLGMGSGKAADLSKELTALSVDFASFHNISDPEALQRFISALSGSGEVLDMFGVNIKEAALNQKMLAMGFPSIQKGATETQKVLARISIIRESMGRQGAIGDAIKTAGSFSNQLKALQGAIKNTAEAFGNDLLPVVTPLITRGREIVEVVGKWIKANSGLAVSIAQVAVAGIAIGGVIAAGGAGLIGFGLAISGAGTALGVFSTMLSPAIYATNLFNSSLAGIQRFAISAIGSVQRVGMSIGSGFVTALNLGRSALGTVAVAARTMADVVGAAAVSAGNALWASLSNAASKVPAAFNAIVASARSAFASATSVASKFSTELQYWLGRPLTYFKAAFPILAMDLATGMANAMGRIRGIAATAADGVRAAWSSVSARVGSALSAAVTSITSRLGAVASPLAGKIGQAWGAATAAISTRAAAAWNAVAGSANSLLNRLKQQFGATAPLIGQDLRKLAGYAAWAARGVISAFASAGPAIARGLTTAAMGAFNRIRSMGASTAGMMARGVGAGARGIGGALSGVAGLISMLGGGAGGALGQVAMIAPQLMMIGSSLVAMLNPATLLIAAVAGGVYLWTQYSAEGKAALNQVTAALEPFLQIAQKTFGGIYDAIKAGDLALAGKIAIAGLKLAIVTGMENLGNLIGGTWGKAVKDIGGKLAGGDFKGAWETTVKTMAAVWDSWSEGVVKTFTGAITQVVAAWKSGVNAISDFLLEASLAGGALGLIASGILGVDMSKEDQRKGVTWERQKRTLELKLQQHEKAIAEAEARGDTATAENQRRGLENTKAELAKGRGTVIAPNVLDQTKQFAKEFTGATATGLDKVIAEMNRTAEINNEASNAALDDLLQGRPDNANAAIADAQKELDVLNAEARKKRGEKDRRDAWDEVDKLLGPDLGVAGGGEAGAAVQGMLNAKSMTATFSAAAAIAMGRGTSGGNPQERAAKAAEKNAELMKESLDFAADSNKVSREHLKFMTESNKTLQKARETLADVERNTRKMVAKAGP